MQNAEGTRMANDNLPGPRGSFALEQLRPGQTLEIRTGSSTYWITRLESATHVRSADSITGVSIQTNSKQFGQITRSPKDTYVDDVVYVGRRFQINTGHTSSVRSFRVI